MSRSSYFTSLLKVSSEQCPKVFNLSIFPPAFCPEDAQCLATEEFIFRSVAKISQPCDAKKDGRGSQPTAKPKPFLPGFNLCTKIPSFYDELS